MKKVAPKDIKIKVDQISNQALSYLRLTSLCLVCPLLDVCVSRENADHLDWVCLFPCLSNIITHRTALHVLDCWRSICRDSKVPTASLFIHAVVRFSPRWKPSRRCGFPSVSLRRTTACCTARHSSEHCGLFYICVYTVRPCPGLLILRPCVDRFISGYETMIPKYDMLAHEFHPTLCYPFTRAGTT